MFGAVRNIHAAQDLVDTTLALGRLDAHVDQRQLDVLEDIQFVDQVERLENKPDIPLAEFRAVFLLEPGDLVVEQRIAARGGIVQKPQDIEQRGLAAARGPMTATNSPSFTSNVTPFSAMVSISSVRKTFLRFSTFSIDITNRFLLLILI